MRHVDIECRDCLQPNLLESCFTRRRVLDGFLYDLGCSFPVKCWFVYPISANIIGKADRGGLARQRKQTDISQESYSPVYDVH